jgi:hypothetical protein
VVGVLSRGASQTRRAGDARRLVLRRTAYANFVEHVTGEIRLCPVPPFGAVSN